MEPKHEPPETIIFNELDQISEIIFFENGTFDVGFEVNGEQFFILRYKNSSSEDTYCTERNLEYISISYGEPIGQYGATFSKQSRFIYKTSSECNGYFIRKKEWKEVMDRNTYVSNSLRDRI